MRCTHGQVRHAHTRTHPHAHAPTHPPPTLRHTHTHTDTDTHTHTHTHSQLRGRVIPLQLGVLLLYPTSQPLLLHGYHWISHSSFCRTLLRMQRSAALCVACCNAERHAATQHAAAAQAGWRSASAARLVSVPRCAGLRSTPGAFADPASPCRHGEHAASPSRQLHRTSQAQ
jgi:hypothetical protein